MAHSSSSSSISRIDVDKAGALFTPVVKKKPTLSSSDKNFIERAIHHFAGVEGAVRSDIRIRTNTRQSDRTVCMFHGLPAVTIQDIDQLDVLSDRVQNISVDLPEQYIRVELAKKSGNARKKRRRGRANAEHTEWKLDNVSADDQRHVKRVLDAFEDFDELECQLSVEIKHKDGVYELHITPYEPIRFSSLQKLSINHRSLVQQVVLDLPGKKCIVHVAN